MTSLSEVYDGRTSDGPSLRRLYLGTGLFCAGALVALVGMLVGTTDLFAGLGVSSRIDARLYAGLLAGLGVPAMLLGVFTVLPTNRRNKAAAVIGTSISLLGVALFWYAYPNHWAGYGQQLTLPVTAVYAFGLLTSTWVLFTAIVNFKQRNDPGGTVTMKITREGETRVVEVDRADFESGDLGDISTAGGIGMLGGQPDGEVETQTNRPGSPGGSGSTSRSPGSRSAPTGPTPTSDGGTTTQDISSPLDEGDDAEIMRPDEPETTAPTDRYCGNCEHFQYVRSEQGMQPYCGAHDEVMDDMEACERWTPNN